MPGRFSMWFQVDLTQHKSSLSRWVTWFVDDGFVWNFLQFFYLPQLTTTWRDRPKFWWTMWRRKCTTTNCAMIATSIDRLNGSQWCAQSHILFYGESSELIRIGLRNWCDTTVTIIPSTLYILAKIIYVPCYPWRTVYCTLVKIQVRQSVCLRNHWTKHLW